MDTENVENGTQTQKGRKHDLLHVGIGVFEGSAQNSDWDSATAQVVRQISAQVSRTTLPPRVALLFATANWCQKTRSLSAAVLKALAGRFGGPTIPLVGSSSPGVFVSIPTENGHKPYCVEDGFVVVILFSEDLWANIVAVREPHNLTPQARKEELLQAVIEIGKLRKAHVGLGTSAAADLFAIFPGPFLIADGTRVYADHELHQDLLASFSDVYSLFGGSAANTIERPTMGYQFIHDECLERSLVIALLEHDFCSGASMGHGLKPVPGLQAVVDELDQRANYSNRVTRINGKPAAEALRELMAASEFRSPRPALGLGGGDNCHVVVPIEMPERWGASVLLNRRIYRGYRLTVLGATNDELQQRAGEVFQLAWNRSGATNDSIRLIIGQACLGRYAKFDNEKPKSWWEEIAETTRSAKHDAPMVIALAAGEFGEDHRRRARGDNFSVWAASMTAEPSPRAENRLLQTDLLVAGSRVAKVVASRQVMTVAIKEGMRIGASGGQICVADPTVGKILGGRHGCAHPSPFQTVLRSTYRELRKDHEIYRLNPLLRIWSVPLGAARTSRSRLTLTPETDILTIACANHEVFFIPDTQNPEFHCSRDIAKRAGIISMLVLPLVGSNGRVLGTLQLAFSSPVMNREQMRLWAGYGQKVALALERALETEQKVAVNRLVEAENAILQRSTPTQPYFFEEVQEFLEHLKRVVGADYLHARILSSEPQERFILVSTRGEIAERHLQERQYIGRNEGSMRNAIDGHAAGGVFTLTWNETKQYYTQRTREGRQPDSNWMYAVREFRTIASILIGTPDRPVGCVVFHSKLEHFFTGPRRQLLQLAALKLDSILRKREANFRESEIKELEDRLFRTTIGRIDKQHEVMRPLTNAQQLFELLRRDLAANRDPGPRATEIEAELDRAIRIMIRPEYTTGEIGVTEKAATLLGRLCSQNQIPYCIDVGRSGNDEFSAIQLTQFLESGLLILLINAKDALTAIGSEEPVAIYVQPKPEEGKVWIIIENHGIKVSDEDVRRMFLPDFSTKAKSHHGLGLPLAYVMISKQGGTLKLAPRPGGGVIATVSLPASERTD